MKNKATCLFVLLISMTLGYSQGFVNLDFENAQIVYNGYSLSVTNAFPGWTVSAVYISYDDFSLSGESISIMDTNSRRILQHPFRESIMPSLKLATLQAAARQFHLAKPERFHWEQSPSRFGETSAAYKSRSQVNRLRLMKLAALLITIFTGQIFHNSPEIQGNYFFPCRLMLAVRHWIISNFHLRQFQNQEYLNWLLLAVCFLASAVEEFYPPAP